MIRHKSTQNALILFILLTVAALLHLSSPNPVNSPQDVNDQLADSVYEKRESLQKGEDDEDELFTEMDPQILAAVLLESLNHSQEARQRDGQRDDGMGDRGLKVEDGPAKVHKTDRKERMEEDAIKDRDGRQELELLMAAQGREQENKEAEEKRKAKEEEERMTEQVASRTTSQTVQVQTVPKTSLEGEAKKGPDSPEHDEEEEEQLNPEELKSLETVMKEFPRLGVATKRDWDQEQNKRDSRSSSSHNEILPGNKGGNLAMSKKKLKWQEETQKALYFPTFREYPEKTFEGNNVAAVNAVDPQTQAEPDPVGDAAPEEEEEEEDDEELLSPEEEEAQARAEQDEMRRQAAEAQRAKMEEEKLADIASDMLLRYMGKQNGGRRKYSSSLSDAAEDKRSDEEQEEAEDDIDPQTIDKLIEISSKLHLPADDVVDIINDVEKKKKKDMSSDQDYMWQRPLNPLASPLSSPNGFSGTPISDVRNQYPAMKQPSAPNLLKTWFHDKPQAKPQNYWSIAPTPLLTNQNLWTKIQRPLSVKQGLLKSAKSGYTSYPYTYPAYYPRKSYPTYRPVYFPRSSRPKSRLYLPKSVSFFGNSMSDTNYQAPSHQYYGWVPPRLRKPPRSPAGLRQNPYFLASHTMYPWTFQPVPFPRPRTPPVWENPVIPPSQNSFFYSVPEQTGTTIEDFHMPKTLLENSYRGDLEKHIKNFLSKRPQKLD